MRIAGLVLIALAITPASARADSIVFRRDGQIWLMAADGTGARQVTTGGLSYEWPSRADDGTIVAPDTEGALHRLTATGRELNTIPTPAITGDEDVEAETPTHVRVSPDGTKIAYDEAIDSDVTTFWTPATATTTTFPNQSLGQEGLEAPTWVGNDRLLLSRDASADEGTTFNLYTVGDGDDTAAPYFDDPKAEWATGFDGAASRDGRTVAAIEDDAAAADGTPTRVMLTIFKSELMRCELDLPASDDYDRASPSLSPDGTQVAWAQADGIHVADTDTCRDRVITLPGAWDPYWSAATLPSSTAATPNVQRLTLKLKTRAHPYRLTVAKRGIAAYVTVSAPTTVHLALRARGHTVASATRKLANAGTTKLKLRVKRVAKRFRLKLTAAGAASVTATVTPR
jgi:hypothetical protein